MNYIVQLSDEVHSTLSCGQPVLALESATFFTNTAQKDGIKTIAACERLVRHHGAVPAVCAVVEGRLCAGLSERQIEYLGRAGGKLPRASRSDLPILMARGADGATTVAASMIIASLAGINVLAAGGIGGVHRGAEDSMDVSADLTELAKTPVAVVCGGVSGILDVGLTLEHLETHGVPVVGFRTGHMPAVYTENSGYRVPFRADTVEELADMVCALKGAGIGGGMVIANPIPKDFSMDSAKLDRAIEKALRDAEKQSIMGKKLTPFLLSRLSELTDGESHRANTAMLYNNARLGAQLAVCVSEL